MAHFVTDADRLEIHADWWDDDETVTIKRFTFVEDKRITSLSLLDTPIKDENGDIMFRVDAMRWAETRLVRGIVNWTLKDRDGNPAPCESEYKCALSAKDGKFINDALNEWNGERTASEQREFRDQSGDDAEE